MLAVFCFSENRTLKNIFFLHDSFSYNEGKEDILSFYLSLMILLMVEVLGGHGELVRTPAELKPALERSFAAGKPALVNVLTDPNVIYPRRANLA